MTSPTGRALIMGIDPGTARTGFGIVALTEERRVLLVECGVIRTSAGEPLPRRIREIYEGIDALLARHRPAAVSVEDVFHGKNIRTALTLGHARGAILLAASLRDVPIFEYTPRGIKKAVVGTGRATKDQVGFMVARHLRLKNAPKPDDAADGVAAALAHCLVGAVGQ